MSELRIPESTLGGMFIIDDSLVNLDDLLWAGRPGAIVRCKDINGFRYIPPSLDNYDRVAGMISEDV